jgi:hypothetical protein
MKNNKDEYPKDLHTATRAEFVTRIRMNQRVERKITIVNVVALIVLIIILLRLLFS